MKTLLSSSPRRLLASALMVVAFAVVAPGAAMANNPGDVWVDAVGQPGGPGHEMNPHLPCLDINLWGDKMAKPGDQYKIYGWEPSGKKELAYSSAWSYDKSDGGIQVIDVIDVETLIANAVANGDAPVNGQGFHFKIALTQDPQKYKTFWVKCDVPGPPSVTPPASTPDPPAQQNVPPAAGTPGVPVETPSQLVLGERVSAPAKKKQVRKAKKHAKAKNHHKKHRVVMKKRLPAFAG
ncbi:MAG TPA: hypothetical protein VF066_04670 [Thermoleophilaceae bacterium]